MSPRSTRRHKYGGALATAAAAAVVIGGAVGVRVVTDDAAPPPGPGTANLWVDTNGGNCLRKATAASYVDVDACATLNAAYAAASAGDTVLVKAGTYGSQTIGQNTTGGKEIATRVTFDEAPGETVTLGTLYLGDGQNGVRGPGFLTMSNFAATHIVMWGYTNDITLNNFAVKRVQGYGAQNIVIDGFDVGPCIAPAQIPDCSSKMDVDANWSPVQVPSNWTISDSKFHDAESTDLANVHAECFFIRGGSGLTFERNHFYNCHIYDIFVQESSFSTPSNVTIQNNWFDAPFNNQARTSRDFRAIAFGSSVANWTNFLIRYNSFYSSQVQENDNGTSQAYTNFRIVGNVMASCSSYASITYDYNVFNSATGCGTNKRTSVAWPYVSAINGGSANYHLSGAAGSTSADDYVTPTGTDYALGGDYDGGGRAAPRDAGSDER